MKILVDKIPDKSGHCLFSKYDGDGYYICSLKNKSGFHDCSLDSNKQCEYLISIDDAISYRR